MLPNIPRGLSLVKILNGISKSLNIAGQVIPIFEKTRPLINNARSAFNSLKNINFNINNNNTLNNKQTKKVENNIKYNNPTFFN